jgi:hypothetical protein
VILSNKKFLNQQDFAAVDTHEWVRFKRFGCFFLEILQSLKSRVDTEKNRFKFWFKLLQIEKFQDSFDEFYGYLKI